MVFEHQSALLTLPELLQGYAAVNDLPALPVHGVTADSRLVESGSVFIAQAGLMRHAIDYAADTITAGAIAVLFDPDDSYALQRVRLLQKQHDICWVEVRNLQQVVGELAARFYGNPSEAMRLIGVTGTDGKTSVTHLLVQALVKAGKRAGSIGTLGYGMANRLTSTPYTTPDAVMLQRILAELRQQRCEYVVMEVSSHALEQYRVAGCSFNYAVLTNLGSDHLDYHGSQEQYAAAKSRLFALPGLQGRVLNAGDALGQSLAQTYPGATTMQFDRHAAAAVNGKISLVDSSLEQRGLSLCARVGADLVRIQTRLIGSFNIENLLACIAVLSLMGLRSHDIEQAMQDLSSIPGRMQYYPARGDLPAVVIDFAHTEQALQACLQALRIYRKAELYCVFGCGGDRDQSKRPRMAAVAESLADHVIVTDDNPRQESPQAIMQDILAGFAHADEVSVIHDRTTAILTALDRAGPDDLVVIAGKGHEQVQIVGDQRIPFSDHSVVESARESRHD